MRSLLLAPLVLLSAALQAETPLATAQRLVAAERKASLVQDTAWYAKNETADYVEIGKDGAKTTKAQAISEMTQMGKTMKAKSLTADVLSAKAGGKELVVRAKVHVVGTSTDPQGKAHGFDLAETVEDTWTKVGGEWRKRLERILSQEAKIDGKSMP